MMIDLLTKRLMVQNEFRSFRHDKDSFFGKLWLKLKGRIIKRSGTLEIVWLKLFQDAIALRFLKGVTLEEEIILKRMLKSSERKLTSIRDK